MILSIVEQTTSTAKLASRKKYVPVLWCFSDSFQPSWLEYHPESFEKQKKRRVGQVTIHDEESGMSAIDIAHVSPQILVQMP